MRDPWESALLERGHSLRGGTGRRRVVETWTCADCGATGDVDDAGDAPDVCETCNSLGGCVLDGDTPQMMTIEPEDL